MKKIATIGGMLIFAVVLFGCGGGPGSNSGNGAVVSSVTVTPSSVVSNETATAICNATGNISWMATGGTISGYGSSVVWTAPAVAGIYDITCTASDVNGSDSKFVSVTVLPKWNLPADMEIRSSDINRVAGEIYAVTTGTPSFVKFNTDGTVAWTKLVQVPGYAVWIADYLKLSPDGNIIYLFWRKPTVCDICLSGGIAVSGFDSNGNNLWTKEIDSNTGYPRGFAIDSTGVYALADAVSAYSDTGIFKLNTSGDIVWQTSVNSGFGAGANDIFVVNGDVYITGLINGNFPGFSFAGGFSDLFVAKYDSSGNRVWATQWGTDRYDSGESIVVVPAGDFTGVYVSGFSKGNNMSLDDKRFLVQKYDLSGNLQWTKDDYFSSYSVAGGIIATETGLYVGGYYSLDPNAIWFEFMFIKVDFNGAVVWTSDPGEMGPRFVHNNVLYGWQDNYIYRYNATTGAKL